MGTRLNRPDRPARPNRLKIGSGIWKRSKKVRYNCDPPNHRPFFPANRGYRKNF